jgi:hypothetical protein
MGKFARRVTTAAAVLAISTGSAASFAGSALADGVDGSHGGGGHSNANCVLPIGVSLGLVGQGGDVAQCNSVGGDGDHD